MLLPMKARREPYGGVDRRRHAQIDDQRFDAVGSFQQRRPQGLQAPSLQLAGAAVARARLNHDLHGQVAFNGGACVRESVSTAISL